MKDVSGLRIRSDRYQEIYVLPAETALFSAPFL